MEQYEISGGECDPNDSDPRNSLECRHQGGEYLITVQVEGAFDQLGFEIKPDLGLYYYDWLDLIYHRDPGLKAGQAFPLWRIQWRKPRLKASKIPYHIWRLIFFYDFMISFHGKGSTDLFRTAVCFHPKLVLRW